MTCLKTFKTSNFLHRWLVVALLALLCSCASQRQIEHGINIEVKGNQSVFNVDVFYGKEVINFKGVRPPGSGGGWNAPMPVPDKMTVRWSVYGQEQEVTIGLKERLSSNPLENWRLRFYGERLELWREDLTAPPSTPTG